MRTETTKRFAVGQRIVTVKVMSEISAEDVYDVIFRGVLHRFATGEEAVRPVPREVKDFLIRTNLTV